MLKILKCEVKKVKDNLTCSPLLRKSLSEKWLEREIFVQKRRMEMHNLFWILLDKNKCVRLEKWFNIIHESLSQQVLKKIVKKLKEKEGPVQIYSFLPEIEVLAYYALVKLKYPYIKDITYEPKISHGRSDVKILFKSNDEVYMEVSTLFESEKEHCYEEIINKIWEKIESIDNNPYLISFHIDITFEKEDIESFILFIENKIKSYRGKLPSENLKFGEKGYIKFISRVNNGHVLSMSSPLIIISNTEERIKRKIRDEAKQLPQNKLGVINLCLFNPLIRCDEVKNAFLGTEVYNVHNKTTCRKTNGVDKKCKNVNVLIIFRNFEYECRQKIKNSKAFKTIPKYIYEIL